MSFSRALVLVATAALLLFALVSTLVISWTSAESLRSRAVEEGAQITTRFGQQTELALLYRSPENAENAIESVLALPDRIAVGVYDETGATLVERGELGTLDNWSISDSESGLIREDSYAWYFAAPVLVGADRPVTPFEKDPGDPELLGSVRLVVAKSSLNEMIRGIFVANLTISLSFAMLILIAVQWFGRWLTNPLERLAATMERAESGETGVRATLVGPSDLKVMERSFNKMMAVLEERETALKQARDAAIASSRAKAEFAANVSHEVRTPLNGVLGMLELLRQTDLQEEQLEYVNVADDSGRSLLHLINDILDFSKIDAGKLQIEHIEYDFRRKVEDTVFLFSEQARSKGLLLTVTVDRSVPTVVCGDPTRLGQVLGNLVSNAIKFTESGEVSVSVANGVAPVGVPQDDRLALSIEVKDTGIGLEESAADRIFDSFTQADGSTTRRYGGTGLGLTISKHLVELMGGEIGVRSKPGSGSTFWFSMIAGLVEGHEPGHKQLLRRRVLVVDEHEIVRTAIAEMLSAHGAVCDSAGSGGEALAVLGHAMAEAQTYDVVILGARLADMSGLDLTRYVRAFDGLSSVQIVMTGNEGIEWEGKTEAAGVAARLPKPVREAQLVQCLVNLVGSAAPPLPDLQDDLSARGAITSLPDRLRVLVAEDNHANQLVARGMLEKFGCEVDVAFDGREAVAAVHRYEYDLVFMDCNMPGMDGLEATRQIRAAGRAELPVIAMTANTREEDLDRCRLAGMDDFLTKPVRAAALKEKLLRWCGGNDAAPAYPTRAEAPSVTVSPADFDETVFGELQAALGEGVSEVIDAFVEDAYSYAEDLRQAANQADWENVKKIAHNLKGSAKNLGAERIAQVVQAMEESARVGSLDLGTAERLLLDLTEALEAAQVAFAEVMDTRLRTGSGPRQPMILVVDDDRSSRIALCNALKADGYRIKEAADGRQALRLCKREMPAMVLLDAVMPIQDGFRTCQMIQQLPEGPQVPVLMITGLDDELSVERAFRAGAADFVTKPVNHGVLRRRVARMMSARKSEEDVRRLAFQDPLTGLANRPAFSERVRRSLRARRSSEGLALIFLDLDQFKMINDTMGHDVGDELLNSVARRLERCVRSEDTIARLGGDEFTICLQATKSPKDVVPVADKVLTALRAPYTLTGRELVVTASVGIALYPHDGSDLETLLKHADTAMYRAKEAGGNAYHFYQSDMSSRMQQRMQLEQDLHKALQANEFLLHYQPQVRIADGAVVGAEALLRWSHPDRAELVPPGEFIGLAEETGRIVELGEWALSEACRQIRHWLDADLPPLRVSVNVSGHQLRDAGFAERVEQCLAQTGIDPRLLEIEVTESVLVDHAPVAEDVLHRIKALGVTTTIDDFGTGFSAMAYLKRFPLDILKVDRSFLRGVPQEKDDTAITSSMIALATSLEMEVVAEGVETTEQMEFLRARGCHFAQGTLVSEPLSADDFARWLTQRAAQPRRGEGTTA